MRYLALLRGINVGGRNIIAMRDLRDAIASAGHQDVATYIQSGNVLLDSATPRRELEADLEALLERRFGVPLVVVLRSHRQLHNVVAAAPEGFGQRPDTYHSDVFFLKPSVTPARVLRVLDLREGVDQAWPGPGVIYTARLSARLTQSRLSRVVAKREYQRLTVRSWKTATKLLSLLDERAER